MSIVRGPNHFDQYKSFWRGPICTGRVQIRFLNIFGQVQNDLDPTKTNWTHPKLFAPAQTIWTVQNHFRPIEYHQLNQNTADFCQIFTKIYTSFARFEFQITICVNLRKSVFTIWVNW